MAVKRLGNKLVGGGWWPFKAFKIDRCSAIVRSQHTTRNIHVHVVSNREYVCIWSRPAIRLGPWFCVCERMLVGGVVLGRSLPLVLVARARRIWCYYYQATLCVGVHTHTKSERVSRVLQMEPLHASIGQRRRRLSIANRVQRPWIIRFGALYILHSSSVNSARRIRILYE